VQQLKAGSEVQVFRMGSFKSFQKKNRSAMTTRGLTVTHAVHAALIQATAELDREAAAKYYTSIHI
jgi:hypothetical protein